MAKILSFKSIAELLRKPLTAYKYDLYLLYRKIRGLSLLTRVSGEVGGEQARRR
jgi:hypothetical protein